jgi:hypothetical protein
VPVVNEKLGLGYKRRNEPEMVLFSEIEMKSRTGREIENCEVRQLRF